MEPNNKWMNDPELQKIDQAKLDFLNKMFVQGAAINNGGNQAETQKKNDGISVITKQTEQGQ